MMFSAPERLPRSVALGTSASRASLVRAWTVVNRRPFDAEAVDEHLEDGRHRIGGVRAEGDDGVLVGEHLVVHPHDQGVHVGRVLRGGGEHHPLRAPASRCLRQSARLRCLRVAWTTTSTPRARQSTSPGFLPCSMGITRPSTARLPALVEPHLTAEPPEDRVVLEQVDQGLGVRDVDDGRHLDVGVVLQLAEDVAADAPEAHQAHPGLAVLHLSSLPCVSSPHFTVSGG